MLLKKRFQLTVHSNKRKVRRPKQAAQVHFIQKHTCIFFTKWVFRGRRAPKVGGKRVRAKRGVPWAQVAVLEKQFATKVLATNSAYVKILIQGPTVHIKKQKAMKNPESHLNHLSVIYGSYLNHSHLITISQFWQSINHLSKIITSLSVSSFSQSYMNHL